MSLDDRLREGLPRLVADVDPPVDPSLRRVVQGGRRRRTLYRVGAGLAAAAVIVAAAVGIPRALEAVRGERPPVGFGGSPSAEETSAGTKETSPTGSVMGRRGFSIAYRDDAVTDFQVTKPGTQCRSWFGFHPTYLPDGFDEEPILGPAPQSIYPVEDGQGVVHWTDGTRSVELRRPGMLFVEIVQEEGAPTITVLGQETDGIGPVVPNYEEGPAGEDFMVQFFFPAGSERGDDPAADCTFHSITEYGLDRDEIVRVAEGLRPSP